uniref:C1q domain-containing protein n=1 Tax=Periophthalmus magnuspinnatus TaxID=409849 RepID=A0A3B3ZJ68_9GOBI
MDFCFFVKMAFNIHFTQKSNIFIAPRKGVYSFAITMYNLGRYKSCASLMVNGNLKYTLMEKATSDTQDSASVSLTLALEAGDVVYVEQPAGCVMCAHDNLYNTYTGYLFPLSKTKLYTEL